MKGKRRLLGPPAAFFCENSENNEEEEHEYDNTNMTNLLPLTIPTNFKDDGLLIVDHNIQGALAIWQRGVVVDPGNYLVHDLISQALLSLDDVLPAIRSAEEVIRISPGWADGYVTLARAQREFGEPELALENLKIAKTIFHKRSSQDLELLEDYPVHPSDSSIEEIQFELAELEGIVSKLEQKRKEYSAEKSLSSCNGMDICLPCNPEAEIAGLRDQQLRKCLFNLCGRVRVIKNFTEIEDDDSLDIDV